MRASTNQIRKDDFNAVYGALHFTDPAVPAILGIALIDPPRIVLRQNMARTEIYAGTASGAAI